MRPTAGRNAVLKIQKFAPDGIRTTSLTDMKPLRTTRRALSCRPQGESCPWQSSNPGQQPTAAHCTYRLQTKHVSHLPQERSELCHHASSTPSASGSLVLLFSATTAATTGDCRLLTGDCRLLTVNWRLSTVDCRLETVDCRLLTGDCRLATGDC